MLVLLLPLPLPLAFFIFEAEFEADPADADAGGDDLFRLSLALLGDRLLELSELPAESAFDLIADAAATGSAADQAGSPPSATSDAVEAGEVGGFGFDFRTVVTFTPSTYFVTEVRRLRLPLPLFDLLPLPLVIFLVLLSAVAALPCVEAALSCSLSCCPDIPSTFKAVGAAAP
jgi:hypothetical protein